MLLNLNNDLHLQLDELEQYGRRPLVGFSGIPEVQGEDTTDLILNVTKKAGISTRAPRQIIARLRSVDLKFKLVKSHKILQRNPETKQVPINDDLTKRRDELLFLRRQLCRKKTYFAGVTGFALVR